MAAAPVGFSWVNYTTTSVVKKDEEDTSIIKSHAMRVVHRQRNDRTHRDERIPEKQSIRRIRRKTLQVDLLPRRDNLFVYQPKTDWESLAISQFMEDFVYPVQSSPENAFQYFSFLPGLYSRYSARSCLTEAVSAVALARLANQIRAVDLSFRARKAYANALSMVNKCMSVPEMRKSDQTLTTLCLLTKYEIVSGDASNNDLWQSHERGQAALISQRGEEQLSSEIGTSLIRLVYIRQQLNCIAQCQRSTIDLTSSSLALAFPRPYLRRLMELIAEVAKVRYAARNKLHLTFEDPKEACRISQDAIKVDRDMTTLANELAEEMKYQSIPNDIVFAEGRYQPRSINIFRDLQHASFWYVFWYGRLFVLETLLQYACFQLSYQPEELRSRLQEAVDDICNSVLFALNEKGCHKAFINVKGGRSVAAHYLIWVLTAASSATGVLDAQRGWISDRLKIIGFEHGIRQALVFA